MSSIQAAPLTVEDYRLLPEDGPRYQLIEGERYTAPAPNRCHQDISLNIELMLAEYLKKHSVGRIYHAPFDVYLDETNAHQPDVVFIARSNYSILSDAGCEGAPDFVVEILSPKTAHLDKKAKRPIYARAGVKELRIVDPDAKCIDVYLLQKDADRPAASYTERDVFSSPHFPGLKISGAKIFKR